MIGFLGRIFFLALQTLAHAMAMTVGYGSMPGTPIEDCRAVAVDDDAHHADRHVLLFMTDQHSMVLRAVDELLRVLPIAGGFDPQTGLIQIVDTIGKAFMLALRIASPFIMYGLIINFASACSTR